jgi:hypothetical protein
MRSTTKPLTALIWFMSSLCITQSLFAETYVYQFDNDEYTAYHDVRIQANYVNYSGGLNLRVQNPTNISGLLLFKNIDVPAGFYSVELQLIASEVVTAGTVIVEILKKTSWTDPHVVANPPGTDSTYPTWNYENYSSMAWGAPGASGAADRGGLVGTHYITNASQIYSFNGTMVIKEDQDSIAFILTAIDALINLYCSDSCGESYHLTPKLILRSRYQRGGLDVNTMTNQQRILR